MRPRARFWITVTLVGLAAFGLGIGLGLGLGGSPPPPNSSVSPQHGGSTPHATAPVTVPNVIGQSEAQAAGILSQAGLTYHVATSASQTVAPGEVLSQSPSASSNVHQGSPVDLVVSVGPTTGPTSAYVPVSNDQGRIAGYVAKSDLYPSNGNPPPSSEGPVPVYSSNLTTVVGHIYPGAGFVALGHAPKEREVTTTTRSG